MSRTLPLLGSDPLDLGVEPLPSIPPLDVDQWIAASILQKAIRRGLPDLAERAAVALWRHRGPRIWHRLVVIAVEDIGLASIDTVIGLVRTARAMTRRGGHRSAGETALAIRKAVRTLAEAPKDRGTDYVASIAIHDVGVAWFRAECLRLPPGERSAAAFAPDLPPNLRFVAAWTAAGLGLGREPRLDGGDRPGFFRACVDAGLPRVLVTAMAEATAMTREVIAVLLLPLWAAWRSEGRVVRVVDQWIPEAPMLGDVPTWALDKHTRAGKAAIGRFAVENAQVRKVLAEIAGPKRVKDAALMGAFYTDAIPIARRLDWPLSASLEQEGRRIDMAKVGVPHDGVDPILDVMRTHYDHLNALRAECFRKTTGQKEARS
jgi:hypothetical protein